ncbi:MAG TPA: hypothetical protein VG944_24860 [Fimbriimonas sp.]|nr:hypothetical protein [Fimbriimonas sp.]
MDRHAPCDDRNAQHHNHEGRKLLLLVELEFLPVHDEDHQSNRQQRGHGTQGDWTEVDVSRQEDHEKVGGQNGRDCEKRLPRPHVESEERHEKHREKGEIGGPNVRQCFGASAMRDRSHSGNVVSDLGERLLVAADDLDHPPLWAENQPKIEESKKGRQWKQNVLIFE